MVKMIILGVSWGHLVAQSLKCSKCLSWGPLGRFGGRVSEVFKMVFFGVSRGDLVGESVKWSKSIFLGGFETIWRLCLGIVENLSFGVFWEDLAREW